VSDAERSAPVVVLGLGLSALGTVRSLGRAGLRPYLACPPGDLAGRTRFVRGRLLQIQETGDPDALARGLERHDLSRVVLIPCTDEWSEVVAKLSASAPERFVSSAPDPSVVELLVDKLRFAEIVERLDVPHPHTLPVAAEEELEAVDLNGYFLKPRRSQLFARRYHRKAFTFEGPDEAHRAFRMIADAGLDAVLQEYVPGSPTAHYFVDGFVDRDGRIVALFARRRLRMFPLDFGNSTLMVSVPLGEVEGAVDSLSRLLPAIGYRGIFSAEFKRDPRDGVLKILEVNARPWWFIEFTALCGVDVSVLAYRDALGLELPELGDYAVGERCVLLPRDVQAYRALRVSAGLSLSSWLRSWIGARATIFAWSDPLPALSLPFWAARRTARLARRS
jgi:D-aspartate ligase